MPGTGMGTGRSLQGGVGAHPGTPQAAMKGAGRTCCCKKDSAHKNTGDVHAYRCQTRPTPPHPTLTAPPEDAVHEPLLAVLGGGGAVDVQRLEDGVGQALAPGVG